MKCKWCRSVAARKTGRIWLCSKHYRFSQMRARAAYCGKSVPEYGELEALWSSIKRMRCPSCSKRMQWHTGDRRGAVVTLQHNRDGSHALICLSCNTRHQHFQGDEFFKMESNKHPCRDCGKVLPKSAFYADRSIPNGIRSYCKECSNGRQQKWVAANRERVNQQQRERRARLSR